MIYGILFVVGLVLFGFLCWFREAVDDSSSDEERYNLRTDEPDDRE